MSVTKKNVKYHISNRCNDSAIISKSNRVLITSLSADINRRGTKNNLNQDYTNSYIKSINVERVISQKEFSTSRNHIFELQDNQTMRCTSINNWKENNQTNELSIKN